MNDTPITRPIPREALAEAARQNARAAATLTRNGDTKTAARCGEAARFYQDAARLTVMNNLTPRQAWGAYYEYACDELGYEPSAAWKYADRELRKHADGLAAGR